MMMKRRAVIAALSSIVAIMHDRAGSVIAEAQEPATIPDGPATALADWALTTSSQIQLHNGPFRVQFNLETFERYVFEYKGDSVSLTPAEMFEALREVERR